MKTTLSISLFLATAFTLLAGDPFMSTITRLSKSADADQLNVVEGKDGFLFSPNELRFLAKGTFWGEMALTKSAASDDKVKDPLPALVDFNDKLKAKGIELILLPVPPKAVVYPDKISKARAGQRYDVHLQKFYEELRKAGVDVLDFTDAFMAQRDSDRGPIYCKTDTHWNARATEMVAAKLSARFKTKDWYAAIPKKVYAVKPLKLELSGDLAPDGTETFDLRLVSDAEGNAVEPDETSPVLLLGDSHTLVFHDPNVLTGQSGLVDHLTAQLGFPVDLIGSRGSASTAVRMSLTRRQISSQRKKGDYLAGKKVIVYCFTAREFTESTTGWKVLPLEIKK
jgi:hypothetical protein